MKKVYFSEKKDNKYIFAVTFALTQINQPKRKRSSRTPIKNKNSVSKRSRAADAIRQLRFTTVTCGNAACSTFY
jgi:hypothetical protein